MPGGYISHRAGVIEAIGADAANSRGTTITAGGTANTKGSWTQLIASTARPAGEIVVEMNLQATAGSECLLDIGIGASGSEQVLIPNILTSRVQGSRAAHARFPIRIPAGSRLAARCQSSTASATIRVKASLLPELAGLNPLSKVTDYGAVTADSGGTSVDPGATANAKGAWTQIVASTGEVIRALLIGLGGANDTTRTECNSLIDVGVGGSGSEVVVLPDIHFGCDAAFDGPNPNFLGPYPVHIQAGQRIAVRAQCSITTAGDRAFDHVLYGIS